MRTVCQQMGRLQRASIPVFLLYGNHDAESEMTKKLQLPANMQFFGARKAESFTLPNLPVVLHGQSFREAASAELLAVPPSTPCCPIWNSSATSAISTKSKYANITISNSAQQPEHYPLQASCLQAAIAGRWLKIRCFRCNWQCNPDTKVHTPKPDCWPGSAYPSNSTNSHIAPGWYPRQRHCCNPKQIRRERFLVQFFS
ncbi:MAG: hypothetical protein RL748_360 [Pseudomonadota bacterium]